MSQPFNGDVFLQKHFLDLKSKYNIKVVIETGTFHGYTTKWLCENFDVVATIESNIDYYTKATNLLIEDTEFREKMISKYLSIYPEFSESGFLSMTLGDSSRDLGKVIFGLINDERDIVNSENRLLIFLDAHWYKNPVLKELDQIRESGIKPVLAIHDFQVPGHPELGYDIYPNEKIIYNWEWIKDKIESIYGKKGYEKFYNSEATGAKRGCLFIVPVI